MPNSNSIDKQVKSKKRVADHGEVFTAEREVNAMLDLVKHEIERINSRFLEPACGTGNFLAEVLRRKLAVVDALYAKNQTGWERYAILAVSSIYGVDILEDNVEECRNRLFEIFDDAHKKQFPAVGAPLQRSAKFLLNRNILWGDALDFTNPETKAPIVFSEWSAVNGSMMKRRDYMFRFLVEKRHQFSLFNDEGNAANIDEPVKDFPLIHFLELGGDAQFERLYDDNNNFIPTDKPGNMKFDVIVGNPPYQFNVSVKSKSYAIPIYDKFVLQAIRLNPRYLCMIIPARWYAGGRGLDDFRDVMLNDKRMKVLVDYTDSIVCFPGVEIKGGVCYFLWDRDTIGDCKIISYRKDHKMPVVTRPLLEHGMDTFVRYNEAIPILNKVLAFNEISFSELVSVQTPFGFISSFKNFKNQPFENSVKLFAQNHIGYVDRHLIDKNIEWVDKHKIFISKSYNAGENFPHQIINKPFLGGLNSCCTQTYIAIAPFKSENEAKNAIAYISTKFFRFMVMLKKISQDAMRGVYSLVPVQDFSEEWTDEKLYKKYNLTGEEMGFIESMIRPMNMPCNLSVKI
ncbi:MAG: Eco57I restriction-modification methylase domain-containing protein [Candidatus Symbiothrix sp.]|jgi:site-specific DNA-methyltransferase (adenine-specific)|nr:Eco57I restriction-modification methylase domain-containing protein [Candidatus Symbiothrix sp.]